MAEVIRSAADSPAPPPDSENVRNNLANVVNAIYEQYGADAQMLAHADDPRADRSRYAPSRFRCTSESSSCRLPMRVI
jgi:hypothetical protein